MPSSSPCSLNSSHEIKRCLPLRSKAMTNLESILKSRNITLLTKVCLVKAMVFPEIMYGCENLTIKKTEFRRIDAFFQIVVLENTLENPLDCKEIKPVNPKGNHSLEGLMLKLSSNNWNSVATWFEDTLEKTLMMGKIEGRRRGWQRMRRLDGIINSMDMSLSKLHETVKNREACLVQIEKCLLGVYGNFLNSRSQACLFLKMQLEEKLL